MMNERNKSTKMTKKPTDKRTALVPPGCLLIVFTTVCYSRMKCKIIYHILKSLRCLFVVSSSPPSLCSLLCFVSPYSRFSPFIHFSSCFPSLLIFLFFLAHVFTFLAFDCSRSFFVSLSVFQGHGIFPWVFAH